MPAKWRVNWCGGWLATVAYWPPLEDEASMPGKSMRVRSRKVPYLAAVGSVLAVVAGTAGASAAQAAP
jgi:hypothetical protein